MTDLPIRMRLRDEGLIEKGCDSLSIPLKSVKSNGINLGHLMRAKQRNRKVSVMSNP